MAVQLSPQVIEWCQTEALGQVLVSWGNDDTRLSYEEVIQKLQSIGSASVWEVTQEQDASDFIMVWDAFEDNTANWIADQIESMYDSYISCAEFAVQYNQPKEG